MRKLLNNPNLKGREQKYAAITAAGLFLLGAADLSAILFTELNQLGTWEIFAVALGLAVYLSSFLSLIGESPKAGMLLPAFIGSGAVFLGCFWKNAAESNSLFPSIFFWAAAVIWAFIFIFCAVTVILMLIASFNTVRDSDIAPTVIILGCRIHGDKPSKMLEARLEAAKRLLSRREELLCIVSGGAAKGEEHSEAEVMRKWLIENGISRKRILLEDRSCTTFENLAFSKKIIEAQSLGKTVAIVSDRFHQFRAACIGRSLGLDCRAVNRETVWYLLVQYWSREILCIIEFFAKRLGNNINNIRK